MKAFILSSLILFTFPVYSQYDVDENGKQEPLVDGMLITRYMFGFRGKQLCDGVIPDRNKCQRAENNIKRGTNLKNCRDTGKKFICNY